VFPSRFLLVGAARAIAASALKDRHRVFEICGVQQDRRDNSEKPRPSKSVRQNTEPFPLSNALLTALGGIPI
jgi:hypothetical protein